VSSLSLITWAVTFLSVYRVRGKVIPEVEGEDIQAVAYIRVPNLVHRNRNLGNLQGSQYRSAPETLRCWSGNL
jgi:hypothetical protein